MSDRRLRRQLIYDEMQQQRNSNATATVTECCKPDDIVAKPYLFERLLFPNMTLTFKNTQVIYWNL
ncbi:hypothetical protein [Methanolapillus millepedarum]|uniref:Uncharacterized protein n=1 Tax=Methanolapillus millepedarum TaxID=3028296 RepID=A0AA96V2J8_9EURY|nr:hypothetical protein MsAc7_03500 [Methanosarcinaceae archaeon Ac7]